MKVIINSNDCFSRIGLLQIQQKGVRFYFVFVEILYRKCLSIFIVKETGGLKAGQGERM